MPVTCIVVNCGSRADRDRVSFFTVPKVPNFKHAIHLNLNDLYARRRQNWISAIKRDDLTESILKYETVCSEHFISGKPADSEVVDNPDWVPNQNMGDSSGLHLKRKADLEKLERVERRRKKMHLQPTQQNLEFEVEPAGQTPEYETGVASQTEFSYLDLNNQLQFALKNIEELSKKNLKNTVNLFCLERRQSKMSLLYWM